MAALTVRLKKNRDGNGSLSLTRPDGTTTWQRQQGGNASFFALHDLTHYAVETVLRHRRGFFGLVAEGWDLTDFGSPWPRGPIPADADPSELIVGFLDAERATGSEWTAADFREQALQVYANLATEAAPPELTEAQLSAIRALQQQLFHRWEAVPVGGSLELSFELGG